MFDRSSINQVTDVHADTRKNFKPQHRSLLFNLQRKDPVEQENNGEVRPVVFFQYFLQETFYCHVHVNVFSEIFEKYRR